MIMALHKSYILIHEGIFVDALLSKNFIFLLIIGNP